MFMQDNFAMLKTAITDMMPLSGMRVLPLSLPPIGNLRILGLACRSVHSPRSRYRFSPQG
jgi:hypothetical protein